MQGMSVQCQHSECTVRQLKQIHCGAYALCRCLTVKGCDKDNHHGDLFNKLRGDEGDFGLVTSFKFQLHPIPESQVH